MRQLSYMIQSETELDDILRQVVLESAGVRGDIYCEIMTGLTRHPEEIERIVQRIRTSIPGVMVAGSTTTMEVGGGVQAFHSILLSFLFLDTARCNIFKSEKGASEEEIAASLSQFVDAMDDVKAIRIIADGIVMSDPGRFAENVHFKNENICVSGYFSSSSISDRSNQNYFVIGDHVMMEGVVAVIFHGKYLRAQCRVTTGWKPVGVEHTITKMRPGGFLAEIDHRPAAEVLSHYLGVPVNDNLALNLMEFPLIVRREGLDVARAALLNTPDGSVLFPSDLKEGEKIRLSMGSVGELINGSRRNALVINEFAPEALLLSICVNRQMYLADDQKKELDFYRAVLPEVTGCSGFGELYMHCGRLMILNCAMVSLAMKEHMTQATRKEVLEKNENMLDASGRTPLYDRMAHFMQTSTAELVAVNERQKESMLEQKLEAEKAENEAKSRFLVDLSHEIRTPITAILGMNEVTLRDTKEKQTLSNAEHIRDAANILLGIVNGLLDEKKIEENARRGMEKEREGNLSDAELVQLFKEEAAQARSKRVKEVRYPFRAPNARVLVVDDTEINLTVIKAMLQQCDIHVDLVRSGREAIDALTDKEYDLVLMDHCMPEMTGTETLQFVRQMDPSKMKSRPSLPIIALTADAIVGMREKFLEAGFDDYLAKPVTIKTLEDTVREHLPSEKVVLLQPKEVSRKLSGVDGIEEEHASLEELIRNMSDGEAEIFREISKIEGMDLAAAIGYCGDAEQYLGLLKTYVAEAVEHINEIVQFFRKNDLKNFTIKIHAFKTESRIAGAMDLSKYSQELEHLGDAEDARAIARRLPALKQEVEDRVLLLKKLLPREDVKQKKAIDLEYLKEAYDAIYEFVSAFDTISADDVMKTLEEYEIPESEKAMYEELKKRLNHMDHDGVLEILEKGKEG